MNVLNYLWRGLRLIWRGFWLCVGLVLFTFLIQRSTYPLYIEWNAISVIVGGAKFDYIGWEFDAVTAKTGQALWGTAPYMHEEARSQYVVDYMTRLAQVQQIEAQIANIYIDPNTPDPDLSTADLRAQRDAIRDDLRSRQTRVESILEAQVSSVLADEGFGTLGQILPPVSMRFTRMPNLLVVSPRDRIDRRVELAIDPLPLEEAITIEERIYDERSMSALVVPIGGMALYPAMIQETSNIPFIVRTFAHEWLHHYLFFYPLGLSFFIDTGPSGREAVFINETAANVFGREMEAKILARYYPDLLPAVAQPALTAAASPPAQQTLDFGAAMHRTRTTVDDMLRVIQSIRAKATRLYALGDPQQGVAYEALAEAWTVEMEAFMENRRQLFYDNGFYIRKLNLAYFAFYGGYQARGIPGVAGSDPIGPAVEQVYEMSPDLKGFVELMRDVTNREELLRLRDRMQAEHESV